ncbi:MAG: hypothetical protein QNJ45_05840 [Ardenticatenaceae bacterium]|nr:hypothetical protein [Ardenticatenaceae bacterium]
MKIALLILILILVGCQSEPPVSPTPIVEVADSPAADPTNAPLATAEPSVDPTAQPTQLPTETPEPTVTPTATPLPPRLVEPLDDGRLRYVYADERFGMTLPPNWTVVDYLVFDGQTTDEAAGELAASLLNNPLFSDLVMDGLRLYGLDTSEGALSSANPATVLLVKETFAPDFGFEELVNQTVTQLQQNPAVISGPELVEFAVAGPEELESTRIDYALETVNPTGVALTLASTQLLVWVDGQVFVLTATWSAEEAAGVEDEIEGILGSLEIGPPVVNGQ